MGIFKTMGLREIINASGKMTALGASAVSDEIADSLRKAAQDYVDIDELMEYTGKVIAESTGAEDGCPVVGAAAGIAIATAAVIAGENLSLIEKIPDTAGIRNEVIVQKGQLVHFGASIGQMIRIGGGKVIEVGQANKVEKEHIEQAVTEKTAALMYIKSHHAVQKGMQPLETMLDIAQRYQLPFIIDAAAEEDFQKYIRFGADIVIYSGGKALAGPTSGMICGKKQLMTACRKQYKGVGRPMKIGKEGMAGLITALKQYPFKSSNTEQQMERMTALCRKLEKIDGLRCSIKQDEAGREIYRAQIQVDENKTGFSAEKLLYLLESGNPAIYLRHHYVNVGILSVDPRPLLPGQEDSIAEAIINIISEGKKK
ncbi:L-seryl-tRNA(Ser) seleniumtransferase/D-glucosaminate-6-phosphate ammonia-lyase [Evansella caseinilytica]|uniref:L-seryl-tRNA(Ser) seleniumtransferase/D-glucosaminate-6-phosphate ammonia-lyase n=1 Tax=Evansella caseinilytica TaxID=1503961 RepID=A0A1H3HHZ0_9BACI|nr:DgaE family pyridoxal phosphate-dependent ammonia lyase [Evansella caseinilytica]SDY15156.1 L-seryl-tRNA(Ser) seleniumtransferase/D-glucosaminate-6-phosphate ammonia-lyase [Evansella caseinilytica]